MKKLGWLALFSLAVLLLALASSHVRASGPPFSDGTLSGAYVFSISTDHPGDGTGILNFDGAGNLTGTIFENVNSNSSGGTPVQCSASIAGTYSVDPNGGLSMTIAAPGGDCGGIATRTFTGEAVHNGHAFVFASSDLGHVSSGVGIEQ